MNAQPSTGDARSDEQIIAAAVACLGIECGDSYWSEVRILQPRMTESLLQRMHHLILDGSEIEREFAADVLGQNSVKNKAFRIGCVELLLAALQREVAPMVLSSICNALGHHRSAEAILPITKLKNHPDPDVRLAVVHGLSTQDDPLAIQSLILLSADTDRDVRNWATFELGSILEADSPSLREALLARITDDDEEISGEALVGLAIRGDIRVAEPLLAAINAAAKGQRVLSILLIEAVEAVREIATKNPNQAWLQLIARCDELGLGNERQGEGGGKSPAKSC